MRAAIVDAVHHVGTITARTIACAVFNYRLGIPPSMVFGCFTGCYIEEVTIEWEGFDAAPTSPAHFAHLLCPDCRPLLLSAPLTSSPQFNSCGPL